MHTLFVRPLEHPVRNGIWAERWGRLPVAATHDGLFHWGNCFGPGPPVARAFVGEQSIRRELP
jgi:hypothetical protein